MKEWRAPVRRSSIWSGIVGGVVSAVVAAILGGVESAVALQWLGVILKENRMTPNQNNYQEYDEL